MQNSFKLCENDNFIVFLFLYFFSISSDPMDSFLLEQHLRSPLRLFPDPLMPQMLPQDPEGQAAFIEKARQHLQMWGRSPYSELLLPQIYQRPNLGALNLGLAWQASQAAWPPQLSAGFLNAAAAAANTPRTPPPVSTPSSSGSPSPDMRAKHFQRFSPYQIPQHHNSSASSRGSPPSTNNNNNNNSN